MVGVNKDEVSFAGDVDEVAGDDEVLVGGDNVGANDVYVGVDDDKQSSPPVTSMKGLATAMSWPVTTMLWTVTTSRTKTCGWISPRKKNSASGIIRNRATRTFMSPHIGQNEDSLIPLFNSC